MLKQALVVVLLVALVFLLRREDEDSVYFKVRAKADFSFSPLLTVFYVSKAADFASKFGGLPEDFESETPGRGDSELGFFLNLG